MTSSRIRGVTETRKVVSLSVLAGCQQSEKQEEPQRVVNACLGIRDGGPNVVCCGSKVHELC